MAQITLKNPAGKDAGTVELDDAVFGIQPNVPVMHQVVTAQLARRRAGTQSTKTRSEVRGGGAKPYRQKGTGNARQGSNRAPHFAGGGVALGPKPRDYGQRTPKKMIRLALHSALADRARDAKVLVVDDWGFEAPSTKAAKAALGALGLDGRVLVVVDRDDATTALSFRNLPDVQLIRPGELNAYDVLCNDWVVFTSANVPTRSTSPASSKLIKIEETGATPVHAEEPAEGPRDDEPESGPSDEAAPSSDEAADEAGTGEGSASDEPESPEAADEAGTGEGSASDEPESPERVSSEGDHQ
jgi:large subunit ribosomal protein L4